MSPSNLELLQINNYNEFLLEFRYKPNSKILDFRGEIAEGLANKLNLNHWRISDNRVEVYDTDAIEKSLVRGFISFRNAGFVLQNAQGGNNFHNRAEPLIDFIYENNRIFGRVLHIERVGVKAIFANQFFGDFSSLLSLYSSHYLTPVSSLSTEVKADIVDIGGNLNFVSQAGYNFNIVSGPMGAEQQKNYFPLVENRVEPILFIDIDSFKTEKFDASSSILNNLISELSQNNWLINNKLARLIVGE